MSKKNKDDDRTPCTVKNCDGQVTDWSQWFYKDNYLCNDCLKKYTSRKETKIKDDDKGMIDVHVNWGKFPNRQKYFSMYLFRWHSIQIDNLKEARRLLKFLQESLPPEDF